MAKPQGHTQILYINMKSSDDVTEKLTLTYMGQYLLMAWNDGTCAISDNKCSCLKFNKCSDYQWHVGHYCMNYRLIVYPKLNLWWQLNLVRFLKMFRHVSKNRNNCLDEWEPTQRAYCLSNFKFSCALWTKQEMSLAVYNQAKEPTFYFTVGNHPKHKQDLQSPLLKDSLFHITQSSTQDRKRLVDRLWYDKGWQFDNCIFKLQKKEKHLHIWQNLLSLYAFLACIEWFERVSTNLSILGWESRFINWTSLSILALLLLILFIFRAIIWFEARWRTCATVSTHHASWIYKGIQMNIHIMKNVCVLKNKYCTNLKINTS